MTPLILDADMILLLLTPVLSRFYYLFLNFLQDNLPAYLEAQLRYRMMNRIKAQLLEFLKVIYSSYKCFYKMMNLL
jgi:hypothetical protein